jgi:polyisoprenoid-binding protein YceI
MRCSPWSEDERARGRGQAGLAKAKGKLAVQDVPGAETSIDAATLWSGEPDRDEHLRSEDFLDVPRHPRIVFRSTRVVPVARNEYRVTGDLTIRGVTHPVTLDVRYLGQCRSPFDDTRVGFRATTRLNRHDFGVSWNAELRDAGFVVGDDVCITIDVEAERPDETPGSRPL